MHCYSVLAKWMCIRMAYILRTIAPASLFGKNCTHSINFCRCWIWWNKIEHNSQLCMLRAQRDRIAHSHNVLNLNTAMFGLATRISILAAAQLHQNVCDEDSKRGKECDIDGKTCMHAACVWHIFHQNKARPTIAFHILSTNAHRQSFRTKKKKKKMR